MRHSSIKLPAPCEFVNVVPFNPLISKCQIKVCYVGEDPNRNNSVITKDTALSLANSLPGSPIVGYFNEENQDFEEHNREIKVEDGKFQLKDVTRPYGFVDLNAKVWFQKFLDDGQFEREYLMTEGWLWTGQYPDCNRVIEKGNNQSMELDSKNINAHWSKDENGNKEFFIINEAIISKLCILGEEFEPCFEGASVEAPKVEFSYDEDFKTQLFSMMNEIKEILDKGGASMNQEEIKEEAVVEEEPIPEGTLTEDPVEEESVVDAEPTVEEPIQEGPAYNLEEIPEYVELNEKFSQLNNQIEELKAQMETLNEEKSQLQAFKLGVEKKEKQAMIDSFYMLSDADKADVIEHIDEYSLNDIEAKLSIICVRNKVSFDTEDDKHSDNNPATYNLNSGDIIDENVPAWIKAVRDVARN